MILANGSAIRSASFQYCGVAALALLFLPLGFVQAQDIEAVKRRLSKAVKHNEITFQQAAVMMHALHEASDQGRHIELGSTCAQPAISTATAVTRS